MSELLTAAQMRACERAAVEAGEVTALELMERAGRGVVEALLAWRPQLAAAPHRAVVLCGPGNNGGDGFVVARLLKDRGWEVEVFLYADAERLPPDARTNFRRWSQDGSVIPLGFPELLPAAVRNLRKAVTAGSLVSHEYDPVAPVVVVDAIFGTGLTRPADALSPLFDLSEYARGNVPATWVAVDVPTGMCADSGRLFRRAENLEAIHPVIAADLTVTFHRAKYGHYLDRAGTWCGELVVRDIGLGGDGPGGAISCAAAATNLLRKRSGHKYDYGHALVLAGGVGKGGAARLAARGALRIGAGLVTVGCPPSALQENASALDAVMLAALPDADALGELIASRKVNALCIGPGFGRGPRLRAFVAAALADPEPKERGGAARPVGIVLDADVLSEYAGEPEALFGKLNPACVLTPHQGEFGRLFPDLLERLTTPAKAGPAYSKVDATREAAARAGCTVLFKGPDTVIADASGRAAVNSAAYARAAPWLATAGTGDVLAGFVTGLLARGVAPFDAAETAAWLHVECARKFGPGLIAEDLPEQLPAVFRDLGL